MKFVSSASILFKSGKGGNGIIAWRRESKVRLGGPAGGNGGSGGSIYIQADENLNSLFHLRHLKVIKANDGENGRNKTRHGRSAEDLIVKVPCGTNVFHESTGDKLFELMYHGDMELICKGGIGGRGNASFKSSSTPSPNMYELGDDSEEKLVLLDLETISDIGLLGKPNAGKSSLLSLLSNAKPKIAEFPFTTLVPVLGTVVYNDQKLVFADIPGLIENASKGAGLGIEFLKHLNRCHLLIHIVDASSKDLIQEIHEIEREIREFSLNLYEKPRLLVLNKIDLLAEKEITDIREMLKDRDPVFISVIEKIGIEELLFRTFEMYNSFSFLPKQKQESFLEVKDDPNLFAELEISFQDGQWNVKHPSLKYWVHKIPQDTHDNVSRLFQKLDSLGVEQELIKKGAKKSDLVCIYDWTFEFLVDY